MYTYLPLRMTPDAGPFDGDHTKAPYNVLTSALLRYKALLEQQSEQFDDTADENEWEIRTVERLIEDIQLAVDDFNNGASTMPPTASDDPRLLPLSDN